MKRRLTRGHEKIPIQPFLYKLLRLAGVIGVDFAEHAAGLHYFVRSDLNITRRPLSPPAGLVDHYLPPPWQFGTHVLFFFFRLLSLALLLLLPWGKKEGEHAQGTEQKPQLAG